MYETVRVVNGYEIKRMIGTRGFYHVDLKVTAHSREFVTFRTIKSAVEFINNL